MSTTGDASPPGVGTRRLAIYYGFLAAMTTAVVIFVATQGPHQHAQKQIAGGYDVEASAGCLGQQFNVVQSGEFVTIEDPQTGAGGKLLFKAGRLKGTIACADHNHRAVDLTYSAGTLGGPIGGAPARATFKRDPPPAGTPKAKAPTSVAGDYQLSPASTCLGGRISIDGSGHSIELVAQKQPRGRLTYATGKLAGAVTCTHGGTRKLVGTAAGRQLDLTLTAPAVATPAPAVATPAVAAATPAVAAEHVIANKQRAVDATVAAFFVAIVIVMLFARLMGVVVSKLGQPRVMGEVLAGILLGPTLLGTIAPGVGTALFPSDVIPYIGVAANLGLIFYMFLVGLELDASQLKGRVKLALAVSNTSLLVPLSLGLLAAIPLYHLLAPDTNFIAFALFVGVAMSITAFPVLARIVVERRMLKRPIGALALSAAAMNDVTGWFLIALASAFAGTGGVSGVIGTVALAVCFCLVMVFAVRPLLARAATAHDEVGRLPGGWITAIFAGVLLSAYVTETIGIAVIFGAFVMGFVMPRHAGLTEDVTHRVEDFVVTLLLPLFFAYTGLRTNVLLLDRSELLLITLVLFAIALLGKYGGTVMASRVMRLGWRESAALGALMNTRGLTELIVLNLALEKGVISSALFAALVIMALTTTFMAGPILQLIDPKNTFGEPLEEELAEARRETERDSVVPIPSRAVLVAPQTDAGLPQLLALAEPLARTPPEREVILARAVRPPRGAAVRAALQTESRVLAVSTAEVQRERIALLDRGVAARAVAFRSPDPGQDLVRLADSEEVDLVLIDGRRPLLGAGVPREAVGTVLRKAPCDVAVLVAREDVVIRLGAAAPIIVPFGGAEHDWAALELGAWLASATGAPLRLLGGGSKDAGEKDSSRLLADASLLVQQFAGVFAEPLISTGGREGILEAAAGAGLLVSGLSERWRQEGLGETRAAIARAAPAPILFVRRGIRPGALAPRDDVTRFSWSSPAMGAGGPTLG
ncbi:MAG: cation:proton antiporter [Solirubrobacteraceae bacterium]